MSWQKLFYITLKDIRPNQNRNRVYTIAVAYEIKSDSYTITLYWGRVGAKCQRKIYTCDTKEEIDQFVRKVLRTRLKHGYRLVEKHSVTPKYDILDEFELDSLYSPNQLDIF